MFETNNKPLDDCSAQEIKMRATQTHVRDIIDLCGENAWMTFMVQFVLERPEEEREAFRKKDPENEMWSWIDRWDPATGTFRPKPEDEWKA